MPRAAPEETVFLLAAHLQACPALWVGERAGMDATVMSMDCRSGSAALAARKVTGQGDTMGQGDTFSLDTVNCVNQRHLAGGLLR
jgi:hypothetical protein